MIGSGKETESQITLANPASVVESEGAGEEGKSCTNDAFKEIVNGLQSKGKDSITYNWLKYFKLQLPSTQTKSALWEELVQIPLLRPVSSKTRGCHTFIPVIPTSVPLSDIADLGRSDVQMTLREHVDTGSFDAYLSTYPAREVVISPNDRRLWGVV